MSSSKLPEEIYHEILIRLPVKTVLRSKSVCKSWYSQISDPNFVKLHLNQILNNPSSNSRLLLGVGDDLHSIGYDLLVSSKEIEEDSAVRMRYPFRLQTQYVRVLGSCNGLVFLRLHDGFIDYDESFLCVWNPATREYKKIPDPRYICLDEICTNGLVYDGKNDDYKFVIGIPDDTNDLATNVHIFSLRSNSWESIQTPYWTYACGVCKTGVLVNGDLHWLAERKCGVCIVYLDISNGMPSFKEIQLPTVPNLKIVSVGVLEEGCLCVVAHSGDPVGFDHVQVWEMQVYGVHESWTKRYVIANDTITTSIMVKEYGWKTVWSFKNGKIVFVDSRKVVLYDPKHGTAVERNMDRLAYFASEVNYVESLVSLDSGTYVGTERIEQSIEDEA